jgi:hypothetical protein
MDKRIEETAFINNVIAQKITGNDVTHWILNVPDVIPLVNTYFRGLAETLAVVKKKDHPVMVSYKDISDQFLVGMVAEYVVDEEDEEKSNWVISMTFDSKDADGITDRYDNYDTKVQVIVGQTGMNQYGLQFRNPAAFQEMVVVIVRTLLNLLDANADPIEPYNVVSDYFTASVEVDSSGAKIYSIVPGEEIKKLVAKTIGD